MNSLILLLTSLFVFLVNIILLPFSITGFMNRWVSVGFEAASKSDKQFFVITMGYTMLMVVLFSDLTNISLAMIAAFLGGMNG